MLRWSVNLFRVRGIQLALHGSFFLLLAYVAWEGWQNAALDGGGGGMAGAAWNLGIAIAFFACVVLHELGHCFAAMKFGVGVRRILLMPIGGMAEFDQIPREPGRELLITVAGPAVNFVLAFGLWFINRDAPEEVPLHSFASFVEALWVANLVMGVFNLIPAFPMDGGRILRALLALRLPYLRATRWAANLSKVVCAVAVAASLGAKQIGAWFGEPIPTLWLPAALFAFIYVAGTIEYRATQRRERDEAHWRETLVRLYPDASPNIPPKISYNQHSTFP